MADTVVSWSQFWGWFETMPDEIKIQIWRYNQMESLVKAVPVALSDEMLGDSPQYVKDIWNNYQDELEQQRQANSPKGLLKYLQKDSINAR